MAYNSIADLGSEVIRLYTDKQYQQAYDLAIDEAGNFPESEDTILYWRACMLAMMDNGDDALDLLERSHANGYWYPKRQLEDEPDFDAIKDEQRFLELVKTSRTRMDKAQNQAKPILEVVEPEDISPNQEGALPLLIVLHSNNSNLETTLPEWSPANNSGWLVAIPQSSQVSSPRGYVWDDYELGAAEVVAHHADIIQRYPQAGRDIVMGGFSMGAGLAIWLTMQCKDLPARGFLVLGPYLPDVAALEPHLEAARQRGLRGYIVVGEQDVQCYEVAQQVHKLLNDNGIPCELELRTDIQHNYPEDFPDVLERGLGFIQQA
jgi:predicted esterase